MVRRARSPGVAAAFVVGAALVTLAAAPTAHSKDPFHAAWTQVGFGWGPLLSRVTRSSCVVDRARFEACLLAMAALAAAQDPPLVPAPAVEGPFGAADLVPSPAESKRQHAGIPTFSLEARAQRERALMQEWASAPTGGVDFDGLFRALRDGVASESHPALGARGFAAYLRRAVDPHTAIAPYEAVAAAYHHASRGDPVEAFRLGRHRRQRRSVESALFFLRGFQFVRVTVSNLDDVACFEASSAITTGLERGAKGVVLDLRGNLGGVSREAACIADLFLPVGTPIVRMEPLVADFEERELGAQSHELFDLPLVVLIDSWSASGAEVIAAALQARGRALIVGGRSFGKGTYQEATPWEEHVDVVYYRTVARLVIPPAAEFQIHGVLPDLAVDSVETPAAGTASNAIEPLREENAYVNPIAPRYPPVAQQHVNAIAQCVAAATASGKADAALAAAKRALWCRVSGTIPAS